MYYKRPHISRWASYRYISSRCKFHTVYTCQLWWKLVGSRKRYCNKKGALFMAHSVYIYFHHEGRSRTSKNEKNRQTDRQTV